MIRVAFIIGEYPPEERRLREDVAKSYSSAEVEVGILSVKPSRVHASCCRRVVQDDGRR